MTDKNNATINQSVTVQSADTLPSSGAAPGSPDVCCDTCHHWEWLSGRLGFACGYCPIFRKVTHKEHGSKCTAWEKIHLENNMTKDIKEKESFNRCVAKILNKAFVAKGDSVQRISKALQVPEISVRTALTFGFVDIDVFRRICSELNLRFLGVLMDAMIEFQGGLISKIIETENFHCLTDSELNKKPSWKQ